MELVCGVDEVARGCLFGRVYTAAVIWDDNIKHPKLVDSKKLSSEQRSIMRDFIEEHAIDFSVTYLEHTDIDKHNILNATISSMHNSISELRVEPDTLMIDGNRFKPYKNIPHKCVVKGDALYPVISAASILAKVYHDEWIKTMVEQHPDLKRYELLSNMGYGTANHLKAIKLHGPSEWHRMSFAPMKNQ